MGYLLLKENQKRNLAEYMPRSEDLHKLAMFFQNFSDHTRLKIITCLSLSEMCVNDISLALGINQTTVSHQLKQLKSDGIVHFTRQGKILTYQLSNKRVNELMLNAVGCVNKLNA